MAIYQLILGNQLFYPFDHLKKDIPIIMIEHKDLCKDRAHHRVKIAFFFSAMRHYKTSLEAAGFSVIYERYNPNERQSFGQVLTRLAPKISSLSLIEIVDLQVSDAIHDLCHRQGIKTTVIPSRMFINPIDHFTDYLNSVKKPFMKTYYERVRKSSHILMENGKPVGGKFSFDEMNRKKCPRDLKIPLRQFPNHCEIRREVIIQVNRDFSDHPGDANELWLPVTRSESLDWWNDFLTRYFTLFGDYEDAIEPRNDFLFHSAISPLLNIGLLTPKDIIRSALAYQNKVPINALEGFIRQVMGWREFIRGIYAHYNDTQQNHNHFNHHRHLNHHWWSGSTGHLPLDDAIQVTLKRGYTHHINRLMIIGQTMLTCEIKPQAVYDWFMALYVDSSDWVMGPNVFGMSQFSDGGIFATKPYICGSNYIRKMSHYGQGDWCDIADGLYWRFIANHKAFFAKNARMGLAVKSLEKMAAEKKVRLFKASDTFISKVTK
ncbi:MAG: cryptochrome/photolyase family protein [Candidatus Margulisiibacteriota bacterium]